MELKEAMGQTLGLEEEVPKGRPRNQKIGSIKNNKINYPSDQKFFHSSDIPDAAKTVVSKIKQDIDPDILG